MKNIFILLVVILLFFYSGYVEPNLLEYKYQNIYTQNWNKNLDGFKIAVISDLHIGTGNINCNKIDKITNRVNKETPDLIVLLGDFDAKYIEYSKIPEQNISDSLKKLKAKYGVYAILGNHDYDPPYIVNRILKNSNIKLLENESAYLSCGIRIVGLKDLWHFSLNPKAIIGNITQPTIVLSHNPDIFPEIPQNTSLTLSGHTHGGEIYIPYLGSPFVPSKYHQRYRKGYVVENNKHIYISGGVATLSNFRFCNPPEVIFINLYKQTPETRIENFNKNKGFSRNYIPYYRKFIGLFF